MFLTIKTLNSDSSKSRDAKSDRSKGKKDVSKYKIMGGKKRKDSMKLNELQDEINQLSPISN